MRTTAAPSHLWTLFLWILEHWQPLLAFASAGIAWWAIKKNQDINRRRATLDLIEKSESSEHYRVILTTFREYVLDGDDAKREKLHTPKNDAEKLARRQVQQYLNRYELVAIGLLGKSLHAKTYRSWMMTVVIRDWNAASGYIQRERWKYDGDAQRWIYERRVYEGLEKLASKWAKKCHRKAIKISSATSPPPAMPSGFGDIAVPETTQDGSEAKPPAANSPPTPEKPKSSSRRRQSE